MEAASTAVGVCIIEWAQRLRPLQTVFPPYAELLARKDGLVHQTPFVPTAKVQVME